MIVIPTYNERENIQQLIPILLNLDNDIQILVVDDNSPDGTGDIVSEIKKENPRVHILHREKKLGLGTAYINGFEYALQLKNIACICQMDADFSHDPQMIPKFLELIKTHDVVVGSRYSNGVNVVNWPMSRLLLSYSANIYTRLITGLPIKDSTGGFRAYRRVVLEQIDLGRIKSDGYSFQIEMNFRCWKKGFSLTEIPIIFEDRHSGTSKMSKHIIYEAIWVVWWLRIQQLLGKL